MPICKCCGQSVYVLTDGFCGECQIFERNDILLLRDYWDYIRTVCEEESK